MAYAKTAYTEVSNVKKGEPQNSSGSQRPRNPFLKNKNNSIMKFLVFDTKKTKNRGFLWNICWAGECIVYLC